MQITIAERLRPFSHNPGTYCLLPRTSLRFQIFPALIRVHDFSHAEPKLMVEIALSIRGPVRDFTVQLDLEKGIIKVWGDSKAGFFRYLIAKSDDKALFAIKVEKHPIEWESAQPIQVLKEFQAVPLLAERLSLGSHKAQDWELVRRRRDLKEIFPIWYRLGQLVPDGLKRSPEGTAMLLEECRRGIVLGSSEEVLRPFLELFLAGFEGILSPRLQDDEHQGFLLNPVLPKSEATPLLLLKEGFHLIRSLFFSVNGDVIDILPLLPPEFHCGRLLHLACGDHGHLDMEWTKKAIRRMVFHATADCKLRFYFGNQLKRFRLRESEQDRGHFLATNSYLSFKQGQEYILDRFEK